MKLVQKKFLKHFLFAFYKRFYIELFWRFPNVLPAVNHPHVIGLELTNDCNMNCIHCHRNIMDRKIGYMSLNVFKKLVDEISFYSIPFVRIGGQGEPSLHPQLSEMMNYISKKKIKLELTFNKGLN